MQIQYRQQLVDLMKELGLPLIACEVGCAEGLYSYDLLNAGLDKLYMVDIWAHIPNIRGDGNSPNLWHQKNYDAAKERVKQYGNKAVMLKGLSAHMANSIPTNSLGLCYIDCDHSYNGVMNDLLSYYPKVVSGGLVAGHDFLSQSETYGVKQAVQDFCDHRFEVHVIPETHADDAGFYFIKK